MNTVQSAHALQRDLIEEALALPARLEEVLAQVQGQTERLAQEETRSQERLASAEKKRSTALHALDEELKALRARRSPTVTGLKERIQACEQRRLAADQQQGQLERKATLDLNALEKQFQADQRENAANYQQVPTAVFRGMKRFVHLLRFFNFSAFCVIYFPFLIFPTPVLDLAAPLLPTPVYREIAEACSALTGGFWSYVLGRPILMAGQGLILFVGLALGGALWFLVTTPFARFALGLSQDRHAGTHTRASQAIRQRLAADLEALAQQRLAIDQDQTAMDRQLAAAEQAHQHYLQDSLRICEAEQATRKARIQAEFDAARSTEAGLLAQAKAELKTFVDQKLAAWEQSGRSCSAQRSDLVAKVLTLAPMESVHGSGLVLAGAQTFVPLWSAQTYQQLDSLGRTGLLDPFRRVESLLFWPLKSFPGLVLETEPSSAAKPIINSILTQLLAKTPAGSCRFLFIDPREMGDNVASFLKLRDEDRNLIFDKACSNPRDIEERLVEVFEHVEEIIQQKLSYQLRDLDDYNEKAPVPEAHIYLVIYDYPYNWSDEARKRLAALSNKGPQAGVHILMVRPPSESASSDLDPDAYPVYRLSAGAPGDGFTLEAQDRTVQLQLAENLRESEISDLVDKVRAALQSAARLTVDFERVAPPCDALWTRTSTENLSVALGPRNATELQSMVLENDRPHALLAGATGSGKSNTLHVIITNLAANHSPEELRFYLMDCKAGTEFKCYAAGALPHAEVISISAEREYGVAVIRDLKREFEHRLELFKQNNVKDLVSYRKAFPEALLPRILVVMDEFQVLLDSDDLLAKEAHGLIGDLARRARSAGIHLLLSTQSLHAGAMGMYGLDASILSQFEVRIAMRCDADSSRKILDADNDEAVLLIRKGAAIYNPSSGLRASNHHFQVAMLPDSTQKRYLRAMASRAETLGLGQGRRVVFDDDDQPEAPASLSLATLDSHPQDSGGSNLLPCVLGQPVTTEPLLVLRLERQSGMNLALLGRNEALASSILGSSLSSLARFIERQWDAQVPAPVTLINLAAPGSPSDLLLQELAQNHAGLIEQVVDGLGTATAIDAFHQELQRRKAPEAGVAAAPGRILAIHGLHSLRELTGDNDRYNLPASGAEGPSLTAKVLEILREGPSLGLHTLAWCNTSTSLYARVGREGGQEFTCRVALQMEEAESNDAIGTHQASQIGNRAAFLKHPGEGRLFKFRPFKTPAVVKV